MDFDGDIPGSGDPFANGNIIDQHIDKHSCQVLRMEVLLNPLPAACGDMLFQFCQLLLNIQDHLF